ncbi:hypothetical protein [Ramlibacter humi]|uniref:Uncharacterized protein n=1 Tax=Ramlibacter humi TaxID=2530451 RepID=A0A4Z0BMV0_9BURK|nr:hypothetical protein [Ramlibacter humi]TFZ00102.1 hypothetical protein EZ216_13415 [Ramlibacter humi]
MLQVLFEVLPPGGVPSGAFSATVTACGVAPGTCIVLIQLASGRLRAQAAKLASLAKLAAEIKARCFDRHRVSVTEVYWSVADGGLRPQVAPAPRDERLRVDDATYLMLERAIRETPQHRKRYEVPGPRRKPRFA